MLLPIHVSSTTDTMAGRTLDPWSHLLKVLSSVKYNKYEPFYIINTEYKSFGQTSAGIDVDILIPRALSAERGLLTCPIIVRIHGGFLVVQSYYWFRLFFTDRFIYLADHRFQSLSPVVFKLDLGLCHPEWSHNCIP